MNKKEIELLNNEIITDEQWELINESQDVERFECLGDSASHPGYTWYSVEFFDGSDIDVFIK